MYLCSQFQLITKKDRWFHHLFFHLWLHCQSYFCISCTPVNWLAMTNKKSDWQSQIKDDQHSGEKVMWLMWYLFGSTSSVLPEVSAVFGGEVLILSEPRVVCLRDICVVRPLNKNDCKLASNWNSCFLNFWCQQPQPNLMSFPKLQFYSFVRCFCALLYWLRTTFLNSHRARGKSIQLVF